MRTGTCRPAGWWHLATLAPHTVAYIGPGSAEPRLAGRGRDWQLATGPLRQPLLSSSSSVESPTVSSPRDYLRTKVISTRATAAAVIAAVPIQVRVLLRPPLTLLFMTLRSEPSRTIRTISGGATSPLILAE